MSLDLFQTDNRDAVNNAERGSAPLLPAGFKESFDTAWDNAVLFGQSFAVVNARHRAMDSLFQQAYDATKDDRFRRDSVQFENRFRMPSAGAKDLRQVYNDIVGEHLAEQPEREVSGFPPTGLRPISPEELDVHAADISKDAREAYKAMAARQGGGFGTFAGTAAGTIIDPINVLTFPLAAPEAAGIIKTGLTWAGIGGGTQAAIEAAGSPFREKVEPGYAQSSEPGMNILESGAFAGTLGATIKALGTGWRWYANKADVPRTIRDAGNVLDSETQVAETNPLRGPEGETAHRAALSKTLDDVVKGDVPNVDGIITPEMMDGYQSRLTPVMKARQAAIEASNQAALLAREDARLPGTMERLSEMQLGEIRGAVDALDTGLTERVAGLTEGATKARAAVTEHTAMLQGLRDQRADVEEIVSQAVRIDGKVYRGTNHSEALHAAATATGRPYNELADTLKPGSEGYVTSQRDFITRGEADKLDKQKVSLGKKINAGEARLEKLTATAEKRAVELPLRQVTAEARAADRKGRTTSEMTKAITRLAEDGYGLKLDPAEIASLADRILKAPADDLEVALRETTEALVEKARAQRAVAPPTPFGEPRPHEEQAAHALRITNIMRMRVQTLAREVGYAMPKEEAGAIAARLLEVKEPDALAILDELVLRPRTLATTMAELPSVVPPGIPTPPPIEAFHGSPHTFDAFDLSKIGSGEGAQSYGHGLYFAERDVVARSYQLMGDAKVGGRPFDVNNPVHKAVSLIDEFGSREAAITETKARLAHDPGSYYEDVLRNLESGKKLPELETTGQMYRVRIHANKEHFLDIDKPLSEQSEHVRNALLNHPDPSIAGTAAKWGHDPKTMYDRLAQRAEGGKAEVSQMLRDAGIPGIKYLDQKSRGGVTGAKIDAAGLEGSIKTQEDYITATRGLIDQSTDAGQQSRFQASVDAAEAKIADMRQQIERAKSDAASGTHNFVVFDDKSIEITHRNGEPLTPQERAALPKPEAPPAAATAAVPEESMAAIAARMKELDPAYERAAAEQLVPANVEKLRADPEMTATVERDLQRMRAETPDKEIPVGVDKDGAPITRTVEEAATDVEQRQKLAEEIRASCGPQPEPDGEGGSGSSAAGLAAGGGGGGVLALSGGDEAQAADMAARARRGAFDSMTDEQLAQLPDFNFLNALSSRINQPNFQRMLRETPPSENIEDRRGPAPPPRKGDKHAR